VGGAAEPAAEAAAAEAAAAEPAAAAANRLRLVLEQLVGLPNLPSQRVRKQRWIQNPQ